MTTIAERFLLVRGKAKQGDFAKAIGINPNTLRNYENGRVLPNQEILERICTQFSVSPAWLLLGVGAMRETRKDAPPPPQEKSEYGLQIEGGNEARLLRELELEREERRDLAAEARRLYREKEQLLREKEELLRENGSLREKLARLEAGHGKRRSVHEDDEGGFPSLFDERRTIPPSSRTGESVHK